MAARGRGAGSMSRKRAFFWGLRLANEATVAGAEEVLRDQEAGALIDEALAPRRVLYARGRGEVEVRSVELPGVTTEPAPRREERVWTLREGGMEIPLPDYEGRVWTEEVELGVEVPLGSGHLLGWARERAGRGRPGGTRRPGGIRPGDLALEVVGIAGMVLPPLLAALCGQGDLAMVEAQAGAVTMGVVQAARLWRGM